MKRNDKRNIFLIILLLLGIVLVITRFKYIYGSTIDFGMQHYNIPDYFRKLFYDTGKILPNFALNLGNGQNIYYLSYYGLFSPIILVSYLLPFISMQTYIIISTIICLIASIILMYKWLRGKYSEKLTVTMTLLYILATPIIFHSHRHIMFINYMPFLVMAMMGVDKYFTNGKKALLILSIFLMIMSSYYFSVSGILAVVIYGIYKYLGSDRKIKIQEFFKDGFKFIFPLIIAIMMAGVLLLPTIYTILEGRSGIGGNSLELYTLFIPTFYIGKVLYGSYSTGFTAIMIISVLGLILDKKKNNRCLGIIILILFMFPLFMALLNGGMYLDGKVFIPFIPLLVIMMAEFFKMVSNNKCDIKKLVIISLIFGIWVVITNMGIDSKLVIRFGIDMIISLILVKLIKDKKIEILGYITFVVMALITTIGYSLNDTLIEDKDDSFSSEISYINQDKSFYRVNNLINNLDNINNVLDTKYYTNSMYSSTSNKYNKEFYNGIINNDFRYRSREILATPNNILYNIYMGNKYVISDNYVGLGYEKVFDNVYKNLDTFSVGYANSKVMSKSEYDKLDYSNKIVALFNYTIIDEEVVSGYKSKNYSIDLEDLIEGQEISSDRYYYEFEDTTRINLDIRDDLDLEGKVLLVNFDILNEDNRDRNITINGIKNTVTKKGWKYHNNNYTFNYTLSSNYELDNLEVEFSKGKFEIGNINIYVIDYNELVDVDHDDFIIDRDSTSADIIYGEIEVNKSSYFSISIPYDSGFKIYVDDKEVSYEKVNNSFIGFRINQGSHTIKMVYEAPFSKIGKIISLVGFVVFILIIIKDREIKED